MARTGRLVVDALFPPRCAACGVLVDAQGRLCGDCWRGLNFVTEPMCGHCGRPFDFAVAGQQTCAACLARPPAWDRARSALVYDDQARRLILAFKHGDQTRHAGLFARLLALPAGGLARPEALFVPVPLHARRLFRRRYNQSALLAAAVAGRLGGAADLDLLRRTRATPSQAGLSAAGRRRNVRGAFALAPGRKADAEGRDIVLVDDVLTTGATLEACARALRKAGAASVSALTVARVVRPELVPI